MSEMRWKLVVIASIFVGVALVIGTVKIISNNSAPDKSSKSQDSSQPAQMRQATLFKKSADLTPSVPDRPLQLKLVKGKMPKSTTMATVLTDEDCGPNKQGISYCKNKLRLEDGSMLEVRHLHDMSKVPCMSPEEHIELKAA